MEVPCVTLGNQKKMIFTDWLFFILNQTKSTNSLCFDRKKQLKKPQYDWINRINKLTLRDNTCSHCFTLNVADPATFLASNSVLGTLFSLEQLIDSLWGKKQTFLSLYYDLINIVNTKILILSFFSKSTWRPFEYIKCNNDVLLHFPQP